MKQWSKKKGYDVFICMIIIALSLLYNSRYLFLTNRSDLEIVSRQERSSLYAGLLFFGFAFWNFFMKNNEKQLANIFTVVYSAMIFVFWGITVFVFGNKIGLTTYIQPLGILGLLMVIGLVKLYCKR